MTILLMLLMAQPAKTITVPASGVFNSTGIRFELQGKWLNRADADGKPNASCFLDDKRGRLSFISVKIGTDKEYREIVAEGNKASPEVKRATIYFTANGLDWSLFRKTLRHTDKSGKVGPNTVITASGVSRDALVIAEGNVLEKTDHVDVLDAIKMIKTLRPLKTGK